MHRIKVVLAILLTATLIIPSGSVWAGESEMMEILIHKLVNKGVLSREEAREIREDVAKEQAKIEKYQTEDTQDTLKKTLSSMLAKAKWSGDLRIRHETQRRQPAVDRNRERFRLRFGFVTKPMDQLEIGVRLATGASGDPTSTNQSFASTFDKKAIFVDQAYGKYTPWEWVSVIGGKMENPYVTIPEGIVWDSDVTPEGLAVQLKSPKPIPVLDEFLSVKPFVNVGGFVISELSNDHGDPGVAGYQGGLDIALPWEGWNFQPTVTYYNFMGIAGINTANITASPAGNTTVTQGAATKFAADYNLMSWAGKLSIPSVLGQPVALVGDYTYNEDNRVSDPDDTNIDDDGAYTAGIEVGKVTEKFGSWKAFYFRKRIETDATFGALTDSDFGGGGTNHKGHILGIQFGLNKYASLGIKYIRTDEIERTQNRFDTFQADLQMKF